MSVYIKGLEMPKGADEHRLIIRANGQVIIDKKTYWEEAEAIPIQPHGRLIDADEFYKDINESILITEGFKDVFNVFFDEQPTIIPAEGGGDHAEEV